MILNWIIIGSIILFFSLLSAWALKNAYPKKKKFKKYDPKTVRVFFKGVELKGVDGGMISYPRDPIVFEPVTFTGADGKKYIAHPGDLVEKKK